MGKDSRLTIRISTELDQWLGEQSERNGLDKAAFARMLLFRAMNGQAEMEAKALNPMMIVTPQPVDVVNRALAMVADDAVADAPPDEAEQGGDVDLDALVAQRLAEAQSAGKLEPRPDLELAEVDPAIAELGMRPHRIAPPPAFGVKSPRIQRFSTWAPGGG